MSDCKLRSFMVPDGPYYSNGSCGAKPVTMCDTHNWTFEGPAQLRCPIGRIEEAAEAAIARIRAAQHSI